MFENALDHLYNEDPYEQIGRFRENYIFENREPQLDILDKWISELINIWNTKYEENNKPSWNERILLCIYICNHFRLKGNYRLGFKYADTNETVKDRLFNILDNFPNTDALDDEIFLDDLKDSVDNLMLFIDNL